MVVSVPSDAIVVEVVSLLASLADSSSLEQAAATRPRPRSRANMVDRVLLRMDAPPC
jgi:hypothetical protein